MQEIPSQQPRSEPDGERGAIYQSIQEQLQRDREALYAYSRRSMAALGQPLLDTYGLAPTESIDTSFMSGFGMVASHWYPAIRIVSTIELALGDEEVFNEEFRRRFRDRYVTVENLRETLLHDPSGAKFLEEMARLEFRGADDELSGALKAITGVRKLYETMTPFA